jgi:uncharacterized membrane protein SpoIIM required for sporulation
LGSYGKGLIALLPHGIIEIPAICLAGAVVYAAHLHIKANLKTDSTADAFYAVEKYRRRIALKKIVALLLAALLLASIIETHVTLKIMAKLTD